MILINKLRRVMEEVSAEKGEFTLFGLFLREEAQDKWDLVVSAQWLEEGKLKALSEFVEKTASIIGEEDFLLLSRIVTLNHDDPNLKRILETVQVDGNPLELRDTNFFGVEIKRAYILRAKKITELEPAAT
jgi:hypothetical protein